MHLEKLGDRSLILTITYDTGRSILVDYTYTCEMQRIFRYRVFTTFMFIPCIMNNKCLFYTNICINKYCKLTLKLLRHVSVLKHHLQGVYSCVS